MFSRIMYICSLICIFYFIVIACYTGLRSYFHCIWILIAVAFAGIGIFHTLNAKGAIHIPIAAVWAFRIIVLATAIILAASFYKIISYGTGYPDTDAEYMIVLGAEVKGSQVSRALQNRLDAAYGYYKKNPDVILIVSGGKGTGEDISEAVAMEQYLIEKGIPKLQILKEDKSSNTVENIRFSMEMADIRNGKTILVTNRFHCYRAVRIAKKLGTQNAECLGAKEALIMIPTYYLREAIAVIFYQLCGRI